MPGPDRGARILVLNHWARRLGGAEHSLIDIVTDLSPRAEVHLLTSENGALLERLRDRDIRITVVPCTPNVLGVKRDRIVRSMIAGWRSMAAFAGYFLKVRGHVARIRPDCIHANVPKSHMTLFLLMLCGYRGRGVVHMREIFIRNSFVYRLYAALFPRTRTDIIAISRAVVNALPPRLATKTTVIYNGIPIAERMSQSLVAPPVKFLYLGRIVPWKGCHLLVEAFEKTLQRTSRDAAVFDLTGATIYWDASYRQELERSISARGLVASVTLNGPVDDPMRVLHDHHVLCMASTDEPFGRVAAEAMGCGLPVIGFAGGGMEEVVVDGETGVLANDIETLAQAMISFIIDPRKIFEMGEAGRARAGKLFNREKQAPLISDFIMERALQK